MIAFERVCGIALLAGAVLVILVALALERFDGRDERKLRRYLSEHDQ